MAAHNEFGYVRTQTKLLVTYGTGGHKSPNRLRIISLTKLKQYLVARHQAVTESLNELWHPANASTRWLRKQQHELVGSTFPFIVAGVIFDEEADLADEEDDKSGWQTLSGLVVLTFKYRVIKGSKESIAASRKRLQNLLLNTPLLGVSIVFMVKEPGECNLHVVIMAGAMPDYARRVQTITAYLQAAYPKLHRKLHGASLLADTPYPIGNDPQAWLLPCPTEGYTMFPVELARAITKECETKRIQKFARKRSQDRKR